MKKIVFLLVVVSFFIYHQDGFAGKSKKEIRADAGANVPVNPEGVSYCRGKRKTETPLYSAIACSRIPCVLSQRGRIKFSEEILGKYAVEIGVVHNGLYSSVAYHQTEIESKDELPERVLNKKYNKKILNLEQALSARRFDTIYVYGILLEYPLATGDLLVVTLTDPDDVRQKYYYYFRYHKDGAKIDADVALINPISTFWPNSGKRLKSAGLTAGLSLSWGWDMDPEKKYNFMRKALFAWKPNVTVGVLRRSEIDHNYLDGFVGGGFTVLNVISGGIGVNVARSPHAAFPYVGVELRNLFDILKSLGKNRSKKWEEYITAQQNPEAARAAEEKQREERAEKRAGRNKYSR